VLALGASVVVCGGCTAAHSAAPNSQTTTTQTVPPQVLASPIDGLPHHPLPLTYRIFDFSGKANVTVWVSKGTRTVITAKLGWRRNGLYNWRWNASTPGEYDFCMSAVNAAGVKSRTDCAPFRIYKRLP
jgi:hypothetical protein